MAKGYIKGITIEFGADVSKLNQGLSKMQSKLNKTTSELNEINRLLKFNPRNVTVLSQKYEMLQEKVNKTSAKLKELQEMQKKMDANGVDKQSAQYRQLEREIVKTNSQLKAAERELRIFGTVGVQRVMAVGNAFTAAGAKITAAGRTITTALTSVAFVGIYAGKKLVEMNEEQVQAENKLIEIYHTRMGASKDAAKATVELTESLQKEGVVADDVQLSGAQMLATFTKTPSAVNTLIPAMNNLLVQQKGYNATSTDAVNVAKTLGKVFTGQTGALKRYGITFTDAQEKILKYGTESEKAATLTEVITQNVGNMNAKFAETDMGKIVNAKNALNDMGEEMGAILLPAFASFVAALKDNVMPYIQKFIEFMKQHPQLAEFAMKLAAIAAVVGPLTMVVGKLVSIVGGVIKGFSMFMRILPMLTGPVGIAIAAATALIAVGILIYKNWDKIKNKIKEIWNNIKLAFKYAGEWIYNHTVAKFLALKNRVLAIFTGVKNAITHPIETAKNIIRGIVDKIKGFFHFSIKAPKVPLPHFGITPKGWKMKDLLKGKIPKLKVEWHKKAMENGMVLNGATIFGEQNGRLLGGGEAGREVVVGANSLQGMVQRSVALGMQGMADSIVNGVSTAMRASAVGAGGDVHLDVYLAPNTPKLQELVVHTYDTGKARLG